MAKFKKGQKITAKLGKVLVEGRITSGAHRYTPSERRTLARVGGFAVPPKSYYLVRWTPSILLAVPCRNARRA